jgi:NADH-quinone oxidoreductase subunit C
MSKAEKKKGLPDYVAALKKQFGKDVLAVAQGIDMPTLSVAYKSIVEVCHFLKQQGFEQLIDLCGVDMSEHPSHDAKSPRFFVVYHLLSVSSNQRVRIKVPVDERDLVGSVTEVWPTANWFERECFDMYGILFVNHPDLRRLLTDYGFEGHPLRKDFPLVGRVEMFFDDAQWRCVYRPNKLENRVLIPRTFPGVDRG